MQAIVTFLLKYYIYFLFATILFILGLIGYLVDNHKMEKYEQNENNNQKHVNIPTVENKHTDFSDIKIAKDSKLSSFQKVTEKQIEISNDKKGV